MTTYALKRWQLPEPPLELEETNGHVALLSKPEDFACGVLARLGQNADVIRRATGLSKGQIFYRLKIANVKIRDYSRGKNFYARTVIHNVSRLAAKQHAIDVQQITDAPL
jgi:hypothetical protein